MALYPVTLPELSDNVFFWLLAADKHVFPRILDMPLSRTRREVIEQHQDLYGHLQIFFETLPPTKSQQGSFDENTLITFLRSISDYTDLFLQGQEPVKSGGIKPPVSIGTWKFLQNFYFAAGGQVAILTCELKDQLDFVPREAASELAMKTIESWWFINSALAEVTGVEIDAEWEDQDNEV
jgi:hypothetical protein